MRRVLSVPISTINWDLEPENAFLLLGRPVKRGGRGGYHS